MSVATLPPDINSDDLIWNNRFFPSKVSLDEDMILVVRQDISIIGFNAIGYLVVSFVLVIGRLFLNDQTSFVYIALYDTIMYSINMVLVLMFALTFHHYYLSMQMVSNKRVIDIDQRNLFSREVNEMSIDKIQDVSHKQPNFISSLFGFGNVTIQTAADESATNGGNPKENDFLFENVPAPEEIARTISRLYHNNKEAEQIQAAKLNAQYMIQAQHAAAQARQQAQNNIYNR